MRIEDVCIPVAASWSSPFVRWQGPTADLNSLELARQVTADGLARAGVDWPFRELVLGITVPQKEAFYGAPTLAARLGPRAPERPDAGAGLRDVGRLHPLGGRRPAGKRRGSAARRDDRPDEQRAAPRLSEHECARRDARRGELGARQLRPRSGHRRGDARDRRARRSRGVDREGGARRARRAAVRAVPRRAGGRPRVPARMDGPDRRRQPPQARHDRGGLRVSARSCSRSFARSPRSRRAES